MATMNLTAISMERELRYQNKSLFDSFVWFDDPDNNVDKEQLKNRILMRCGEFEVLYSDPEFFASCINVWSAAYKRTFDKWLLAIYSEYNPIENYNMEESFTDTGSGSKTGTGNTSMTIDADDNKSMSNSSNGSASFDGSIVNTQTSNASRTEEHKVSAFDSSTYSPESQNTVSDNAGATANETNKNTTTSTNSGTATETNYHDETQTGTHSNNETTTSQNLHTGARHGNIGVTTSQQMLEQEFKVALFSFYDRVADLFVKEFCVMVY